MDNRGSKSVVRYYSTIVKEQRVNGCRYLQDFCNIFKMYSNELRNKLYKKNCILEIYTIHR
jgi:hypothetical protein